MNNTFGGGGNKINDPIVLSPKEKRKILYTSKFCLKTLALQWLIQKQAEGSIIHRLNKLS